MRGPSCYFNACPRRLSFQRRRVHHGPWPPYASRNTDQTTLLHKFWTSDLDKVNRSRTIERRRRWRAAPTPDPSTARQTTQRFYLSCRRRAQAGSTQKTAKVISLNFLIYIIISKSGTSFKQHHRSGAIGSFVLKKKRHLCKVKKNWWGQTRELRFENRGTRASVPSI